MVTVHSPTRNQTYDSTNVWLNLTVTKPESWFRRMAPDDQQPSEWDIYIVSGKITSVYYCLDGAEKQSIFANYTQEFEMGVLGELPRTVSFSVNLSLPEGVHNVTVGAEGESYYAETVSHYYSYLNATITDIGDSAIPFSVSGSSETVTFTVVEPTPPEIPFSELPTTFPTETVVAASGASAILIGVCLLVYFKRRKR